MPKKTQIDKIRKPGTGGDRSASHIMEQRLLIIEDFLCRGMKTPEIKYALEQLRDNPKNKVDLDFDDRTLTRYIAKGQKNISDAANHKRKYLVNRSLRRYDTLYQQAIGKKDIKAALIAQKNLEDFLGLKAYDY